MTRVPRRVFESLDLQLLLLILAFTLPVSLQALRSFFTFDDLMNLHCWATSGFTAATARRRPETSRPS